MQKKPVFAGNSTYEEKWRKEKEVETKTDVCYNYLSVICLTVI